MEELMKEVEVENRNTTSSEKPRIPKRLKQLYLFRKVWFKETIIDSVLQMNVLSFHRCKQ